MTQPKEQDGQLLLQIWAQQEHGAARRADLVDGGARQPEDDLGGQTVAELGVDVVGADDAFGELGPGVGGLVGEPGAAEDCYRLGAAAVERLADGASGPAEGVAPRGRGELVAPSGQGRVETVGAVDGLEVEAALVAEPAPVDRVDVDSLVAQHLVAARLHDDAAAHRAGGAGRLGLVEVPRPRLEAIGGRGERADRADLHCVAREVGRELMLGECVDLRLVAAVDEADERIAGHVLGEARAAIAEDAALAVEIDEIGDGDGLGEVPLLLHEAALTRSVGHRLVLQGTLAALVAHGAVEWMVDEQELEHAVLGLLGDLGLGVDSHPVGHRDHARRLQCRSSTGVDLDDTHAAHAHRLHPRVVAEAGYVGAVALGRGDDELAWLGVDLLAVDGDGD